MNAHVSQELVRVKLEELRKQASNARLARSVSSHGRGAGPEPGRLRSALGSRLVRLGLRVGGEAAME